MEPTATVITAAFGVGMIGLLVKKVVDFLRYLRAKDWNGVTTQAISWAAAVGVIMLAAHAAIFEGLGLPIGNDGTTIVLSDLDTASLILLGLTVGSLSSTVNDTLGAFDSSRSTQIPQLVPPPP